MSAIKLDGLNNDEIKTSQRYPAISGPDGQPLDAAQTAAIFIEYLRQEDLLNTKEGRALYKECLLAIKGTKWEQVAFPKMADPEGKRLADELFRRME